MPPGTFRAIHALNRSIASGVQSTRRRSELTEDDRGPLPTAPDQSPCKERAAFSRRNNGTVTPTAERAGCPSGTRANLRDVGHEGRPDHYHRDRAGVGYSRRKENFAVKATLFLAAAAYAVNGEINALRIGLAQVTPGQPFGVGAVIEVPWVQAVDDHTFRLELVEEDGTPFEVQTSPDTFGPIVIEGKGGTGIPAGHRVGSPRIITVGGNFVLPLAHATRYEWRLSIDGQTNEGWRIGFDTTPPPLGEVEQSAA